LQIYEPVSAQVRLRNYVTKEKAWPSASSSLANSHRTSRALPASAVAILGRIGHAPLSVNVQTDHWNCRCTRRQLDASWSFF